LLREQVSIRDLRTIFETLADEAPRGKDVELLIEGVRRKLSRSITAKYKNDDGVLSVLSLSPHIEDVIANSLLQSEQGVQLVMDPRMAQTVISEIARAIENNPEIAANPVLLTPSSLRRHMRKLTERFIPQLAILSQNEISTDVKITSVGMVEVADAG
jgi:flagellar biosynthesis protein FlhA